MERTSTPHEDLAQDPSLTAIQKAIVQAIERRFSLDAIAEAQASHLHQVAIEVTLPPAIEVALVPIFPES